MRPGPRARRRPGGQIEPACRTGLPSRRPHSLPQGRSASLFLSLNLPAVRVARSGDDAGPAVGYPWPMGLERSGAGLLRRCQASGAGPRPGAGIYR